MQFSRRQKRQSLLTGKRDPALYPYSLQFYNYPPTDIILLPQFEELALERLKVLRLFERAGAKFNKNSRDYKDMIRKELKTMELHHYYKSSLETMNDGIYDERRRDHLSHYILRLAYCRREDLRRWFINQEVDLFRYRFTNEQTKYQESFMRSNNLNYDEISEEERDAMADKLNVGFSNNLTKVKNTNYYRVPFLEVLDLVKNRRTYLKQGYAYITQDDLVLTVLSAYRTHLSHEIARTSRILPPLQDDSRLISMLDSLHQRYFGTDYSKRKVDYNGEVSPEQIDGLAKTSFPLCMRNLHEVLRRNHHLKYNGRLQYGLFLKGIGLTLEDAMRFWRDEFTKTMDVDKFDKQYSYNIRYNYGKEGKRANFSPYTCMKIITSNSPGPGEFHGCPFKHSDESNLRQRLQNLHISSGGVNNVVDLASKGHYQIACTRYFELTHNEVTPDQGISHPNHYYEESQKVLHGKKDEKNSSVASTTSKAASITPSQNPLPQTTAENDDDMDCGESMDDIEDILRGLNGV